MDRYCIVELEFWKDSLRRLNSRDLFSCNPPFISVYSDASDVACGGHILGKDIFAHRMFTNAERTQISTYRELAAILFVLNALRPFLSSSRVKWFMDNQGAARIVQVGSMHFRLHLLASDIFSFCYNHGINLEIDWVPARAPSTTKQTILVKLLTTIIGKLFPRFSNLWTVDGAPILSTVSPLFTTLKFQDSFLGCGIQVHLAWMHFFKPGKVKTCEVTASSPVEVLTFSGFYTQLLKLRS